MRIFAKRQLVDTQLQIKAWEEGSRTLRVTPAEIVASVLLSLDNHNVVFSAFPPWGPSFELICTPPSHSSGIVTPTETRERVKNRESMYW